MARTKTKRPIALRLIIGVLITIGGLIAIILSMIIVPAVMCEFSDYTVFERILENGDTLKVRMEPDCSMTVGGGDRFTVYVKTPSDTNYKRLVNQLRRASSESMQIDVNAPTPLILLPDADSILLRDAKDWAHFSALDIVNRAMPAHLPLASNAIFTETGTGFDSQTDVLSLTASWGVLTAQQVTLKAHEHSEFVWFEPTAVDDVSSSPIWLGSNSGYAVQLLPDARLKIWRYEDVNSRSVPPPALLTLRADCPGQSTLSCALMRVYFAKPAALGKKAPVDKIDWVATSWPIEPRRFVTRLHWITHDKYIDIDFELLAPLLNRAPDSDTLSVEIAHVWFNPETNITDVFINVDQAPIQYTREVRGLSPPKTVVIAECSKFRFQFQISQGLASTDFAGRSRLEDKGILKPKDWCG